MEIKNSARIIKERVSLQSVHLDRRVEIDFYLPTDVTEPEQMSLLLINDGQDMDKLGFENILETLYTESRISPLLCAGIHAGPDRKMEYGTAGIPDYKGRGSKASLYLDFIFEELLPFIHDSYRVEAFKEKAIAGFSMGGLSAIDIVCNRPYEFSRVGIFSGSLWWRTKDQNDKTYSDDADRIVHNEVRNGGYYPWLKFFFECGTADEMLDRNNNGIIDSIDDTQDLIKELVAKGYSRENDITYMQIQDGHHDVPTWAIAMPEFLKWGWGTEG